MRGEPIYCAVCGNFLGTRPTPTSLKSRHRGREWNFELLAGSARQTIECCECHSLSVFVIDCAAEPTSDGARCAGSLRRGLDELFPAPARVPVFAKTA